MLTRFRHVAAFVLLGLCFAVVALWWRSVHTCDIVISKMSAEQEFIVASLRGGVELSSSGPMAGIALNLNKNPGWNLRSDSASRWVEFLKGAEEDPYSPPFPQTRWGFAWESKLLDWEPVPGWYVRAPHWFLALLTLAAAFAVRPATCFRFSLRQAMVAVTLAAVVFGLILGTMPRS